MSFVYRETLGRPLTWLELDSNFRQVDDLVSGAAADLGNASTKANEAASSSASASFSASQAAISANAANNAVSPLLPLIQTGSSSAGAGALPFDPSLVYQNGSAGFALSKVQALFYQDGVPLTITSETQVIVRGSGRYYPKLPATLPRTLSGTWADDSQYLVSYIDSSQANTASNIDFTYPNGDVGKVQDLSDAVKGTNLVGFKAAGEMAVSRSLSQREAALQKSRVYVIDYMTDAMIVDVYAGTMLVDTLPAYVAAQNALPVDGGLMIAPAGTSRLDGEFQRRHAVSLWGTGSMYSTNGTSPGNTVFVPNHSGRSCMSVVGANGCHDMDYTIKAYPSVYPKVGLLAGRSSAASAGQHSFDGVSVLGHYSVAPVVSIASEDIDFQRGYVWLFGGGAKYCYATGVSDSFGIGGLTTSSNLHITMSHFFLINSSTDANAACMYQELAQASGNVCLTSGYMIAYSGAYIHLSAGAVDGVSPIGTFTFNVNGERLSGGDPIYGIRVSAAGTQTIKCLTISGGRFDLLPSNVTTHYDIFIPGNVILDAPNIVMPPPEAFPYATSQVNRSQIHGGVVTVGRAAKWALATLQSGWSNTFGAPYPQASTRVGSDNELSCRGVISGSSAGIAFFVPSEFIPPYDMEFSTTAGATPVVARIKVSSVDGAVTISGTQFAQVNISCIRYNLSVYS